MREHIEFDEDPRFLAFLAKARSMRVSESEGGRPLEPEEPAVWIGDPLFRV